MGFESFQVELRSKAHYVRTKDLIQSLPNVRFDPDNLALPGSTNFVMSDGQHVIEMQISCRDSVTSISCRFMLCHPPTIDREFLELIRKMMEALDASAVNREEIESGHPDSYSLREFAEFRAAVARCIARRRKEWTAEFGEEQLAASSKDVYDKFILPRCQPPAPAMNTPSLI